jgi:hypothetical protein
VPDTWNGSRSPTGAIHWPGPGTTPYGGAGRGDGATLAPASTSNTKAGRRRLNRPIRAVKQRQSLFLIKRAWRNAAAVRAPAGCERCRCAAHPVGAALRVRTVGSEVTSGVERLPMGVGTCAAPRDSNALGRAVKTGDVAGARVVLAPGLPLNLLTPAVLDVPTEPVGTASGLHGALGRGERCRSRLRMRCRATGSDERCRQQDQERPHNL